MDDGKRPREPEYDRYEACIDASRCGDAAGCARALAAGRGRRRDPIGPITVALVLRRIFGISHPDPSRGRQGSRVIHPSSPFAAGAPPI